MYYSNEAVLIDISYARYCSLEDWNSRNIRAIHKGEVPKYSTYSTIRDCIVTIESVMDRDELSDNQLLVLVKNKYWSTAHQSSFIACRVQDLLYTDKGLISISLEKRNRESSKESLVLNVGAFKKEVYNIARDSSDSILSMYNPETLMTEWLNHRRTSELVSDIHSKLLYGFKKNRFVDKTDSRLSLSMSYSRSFLSIPTTAMFYRYRDSVNKAFIPDYRDCCLCSNTGAEYNSHTLRDKKQYYCFICWTSSVPNSGTSVNCDCCDCPKPLSRLFSVIDKYGTGAVSSIYTESELYLLCGTCLNDFYKSCSRCRSTETVDIEQVRRFPPDDRENIVVSSLSDKFISILSQSYCRSCADIEYSRVLARPWNRRTLPSIYTVKSEFNRFIGIESEVISEYDDYSHYLEYSDIESEGWNVVDDGSLSSGGVEFVSQRPVLGQGVETALRLLERENRENYNHVDESCGIHIHFNALDFGFVEMKSLLLIMSKLQYAIYDSIPEYRRDSSYLREIKMSTKEIESINNIHSLVRDYYHMANTSFTDTKYNEARYIGTNLHARFFLGTIEFRYHEGSIKSQPILNWIRFLNSIMQSSKQLSSNTKLYNKIISNKTSTTDLIEAVSGHNGVEYIESRVDMNDHI